MKIAFLIILLSISIQGKTQPNLKFDIENYQYGEITQGSNGNREFKFINDGDQPLIIQRVTTGDGGSFASYPKEPIAPGDSGVIKFHYDTKRIGPFSRSLHVRYNSDNVKGRAFLRIKGTVIYPRTTVEILDPISDVGVISFGEIDSVTVRMKNTGKTDLHIHGVFPNYTYPEEDIFYYRIIARDKVMLKNGVYKTSYAPGEEFDVTIVLRNVHGNTQEFERKLPFKYNSNDTLYITLKGKYVGGPNNSEVHETKATFHYEDNQLYKKTTYDSGGKVVELDFFRRSECYLSQRFNWRTGEKIMETTFENGRQTKRTVFNKPGH